MLIHADTDQTGRMPRLIWVFTGRTGHFVGFVLRWLKSICFICEQRRFWQYFVDAYVSAVFFSLLTTKYKESCRSHPGVRIPVALC